MAEWPNPYGHPFGDDPDSTDREHAIGHAAWVVFLGAENPGVMADWVFDKCPAPGDTPDDLQGEIERQAEMIQERKDKGEPLVPAS